MPAAHDPSGVAVPPGLKGVAVARTAVGDVRGEEGFYHYRQYSAADLARSSSFEAVWRLPVDGELGAPGDRFADEVAHLRTAPAAVLDALPSVVAATGGDVLAALGAALPLVAASDGLAPVLDRTASERRLDALRIAAVVPTLVAAASRLASGATPIPPDPALPVAADYLRMLTGAAAAPRAVQALERYLVLTVDHGFNASTFAARVVASTGADVGAAVTAGLGALSGPLHGGAPSRVLDMLEEVDDPASVRAWARERVAAGHRIMGFGHPVYRTDDPRSVLLRETAVGLGGPLADVAVDVERELLDALAQLKPDRVLRTNVEFYAAVVLEQIGLPRALFTPTFAVSRVVGWTAHILEQAVEGQLIRPSARYVGPPPDGTRPHGEAA